MRLTVYYDGQFWCGLFEEPARGGMYVRKHVFGAEPSDREVLVVTRATRIDSLQGPVAVDPGSSAPAAPANPKRRAREAARAVRERGIATRSQEVLKQAWESEARLHEEAARKEREARREEIRALKHAKALKRHKGH